MADVAQMEAQQASDAYNLTHQQNLYETAMLTLKQKMNFPIEEALLLDTCLLEQSTLEQEQLTIEHADNVFRLALNCNPVLNRPKCRNSRQIWTVKFHGVHLFHPSVFMEEFQVLIIKNYIKQDTLRSIHSLRITSAHILESA